MTESFWADGRDLLSSAGTVAAPEAWHNLSGTGEAVLIDRLIDLVLALEPLELKQHDASDLSQPITHTAGESASAPVRVAESTQAMLSRMRAVLDREAARLGSDGAEGKAAVDQVALIARTLEKIDQMERLMAEDQARAAAQSLSAQEREQLRQTVRQLILAAAERLAAERAADELDQGECGSSTGATETAVGEIPGQG